MKKTLVMGVCLGLLGFGCQSQEENHAKTQKMQPAKPQDQNYHDRRKSRSQGGCCGAERLEKPADLQNESAK